MRLTLIFALIASPAMAQSPFGADSTPNSWRQLTEKYRYKCPGPFTKVKEPDTVKMAGFDVERNRDTWTIKGSTKAAGTLNIGVLGAIKDMGEKLQKP